MARMKWLEGWVGFVAGGAGMLAAVFSSVISARTLNLTNEYAAYYTANGSLPVGQQWIRLLIGLPTITATLLFAGLLWGLWLDLAGQRTRGRGLLLGCAALVALLPFFSPSQGATMTLFPVMPFALLGLAAGALACLRREHQPDGAR
jgi:hypothetical protein